VSPSDFKRIGYGRARRINKDRLIGEEDQARSVVAGLLRAVHDAETSEPDRAAAFSKSDEESDPERIDTLTTRYEKARLAAAAGETANARQHFEELLLDRQRVLGPDHPDTLTTRYEIARLAAAAGETANARQHFEELLLDRQRVLGPDHPDTLTTRYEIARLAAAAGETADARQHFDMPPLFTRYASQPISLDNPELPTGSSLEVASATEPPIPVYLTFGGQKPVTVISASKSGKTFTKKDMVAAYVRPLAPEAFYVSYEQRGETRDEPSEPSE
jgi:hypothetical protein